DRALSQAVFRDFGAARKRPCRHRAARLSAVGTHGERVAQTGSGSPSIGRPQRTNGRDSEGEELVGLLSQFSWTDYLLALPITLLALFALGILLIDLMLPAEMKWANAVT